MKSLSERGGSLNNLPFSPIRGQPPPSFSTSTGPYSEGMSEPLLPDEPINRATRPADLAPSVHVEVGPKEREDHIGVTLVLTSSLH